MEPAAEIGPSPAASADGGINLLEVVYGVFFSPRATFSRLAARPPLGLGLATAGVVTLLTCLAEIGPVADVVAGLEMPNVRAMVALATSTMFLLAVVNFFFSAAVYDFLAQLMGGRGSARGMLALQGIATLPNLLQVPIAAFTGGWVALIGLAFGVWGLILRILAVRALYGVSGGRAAVCVLVVPVSLGLTAALIIIGLVVAAVMQLPHILPGA